MNFLITGGAGSVGRDLTALLLEKGHRVRVLDKRAEAFAPLDDKKPELIQGSLEDSRLVREALRGMDTVIHLAWSFSDDPIELLESDLKGHVVLLDACVEAKVSRLFYASTAVVYGKPVQAPITEESPCLVEEARKPFYAVAKQTAEKLALTYWRTKGLPVTVFRFWWSYGKKIGGRHLRDMIARALNGQPLMVPEGAGGSFLDHDDFGSAMNGPIGNIEQIRFRKNTLQVQARFEIQADAWDHCVASRNLSASAAATKSGTKQSTRPPSRATSRTIELFR